MPTPAAPSTHTSPATLAEAMLRVWHTVTRGTSLEVYELLDELRLTQTQMRTLLVLEASCEPVAIGTVAELVGSSVANSSRTLDALLRRGWVERRECPSDGRVRRVALTAEGRAILRRIDGMRLTGLQAYTETLSAEQRDRLAAALDDLPTDALHH